MEVKSDEEKGAEKSTKALGGDMKGRKWEILEGEKAKQPVAGTAKGKVSQERDI